MAMATITTTNPFSGRTMAKTVGAAGNNNTPPPTMILSHVALAALGAAIGIGLIGFKATEATGRNPGAATSILVLSIILAALVEGIFIISAFAVH